MGAFISSEPESSPPIKKNTECAYCDSTNIITGQEQGKITKCLDCGKRFNGRDKNGLLLCGECGYDIQGQQVEEFEHEDGGAVWICEDCYEE